MNKTISVNLGGRNFFIEEGAYKKLDAYLSAIKQRFAQYPGSAEIVADMESRIGEKFADKYQNDTQAVISESDVNSLISELGSVEDIAGEDKADVKTAKSTFAGKRLMRNGDDKIIAGVASGLAAYFDVDPFIFRIIFGVLIFAWGAIIPIYLLLWLIMPEARTATEKMQMRGEPLNIDSIGETIKERAQEFKQHVHNVKENKEWKQWTEDVKDKAQAVGQEINDTGKRTGRGLGSFLRQVFAGIGKIIVFFVVLLRRVISLALIVAFGVAVAGVTLAFAVAIFNSNSPYLGLPLAGLAHGVAYYVLLVLAYIFAIIPLQFLLLLSTSIFAGKRGGLRAPVAFSLFGVWMLALIIGGAVGARYVPGYVDQIKNSPQLQTVSRTFDAKDFNRLELSSSISYKLIQGDIFSVKASGWVMDLDKLNVNVDNGTLKISEGFKGPCIFCISGSPRVEITAPDYLSIRAANSSDVESDLIVATSTSLTLNNSSDAKIYFIVQDLTLNLANSSSAKLSGTGEVLTAKLTNSSHLSAKELFLKNADMTTTNSSLANINVSDNLKYNSYNSSQVYYLGNPVVESNRKDNSPDLEPIPAIPNQP